MRHWLLFTLIALTAYGEWSTDPGTPLDLGTGIDPQVVATSDGGAYVAWLTTSNFHIYLQRLDINGNPQWNPGGILISDAPNSSWIAVYHMNLVVDAEDNAVITSVDTRTGNWEVYAYKVNPDGNHAWNEDGLVLSSSGGDNISPRLLAVPVDSSVIVTWCDNFSTLRLQKVGPTGQLLWGTNGISVSTFNASLVNPQSALSAGGSILVQAIKQTGSFPALSSQVIVQKYSLDGTAQWTSWVPMAGSVSFPMGNWLQDIQPDSEGGAFSSWTELTTQNQVGKVQSVDALGTLDWSNSVEPSTTTSNFRISPQLALANDGSGVYAAWGESNASQTNRGILAQYIDTSGTRRWGEGGLIIEAMGSSTFLNIHTTEIDNDLSLGYVKQYGFGSGDIYASRLDSMGTFVWDSNIVAVTNSGADISDLDMARGVGHSFFVWVEDSNIKAHCLLDGGSLGTPGDTPLDTLNYFPMAVGQRWYYAGVYDSTYITVMDSFLMGDRPYYEFDAWYPNESINAFHFEGYEVVVNSGAADQLLYDFGVDLNASWNFQFPGTDPSEITLTSLGDTIETPYGTFDNCIGFHRFIGADYEYYDWFAPDIGLVQRDVVTFAGPQRYSLYDIEQVPVGVDKESPGLPDEFILYQNYPNPFNPSTRIQYQLPEHTAVSVRVFDVNGRQVSVLRDAHQNAGTYTLEWNGTSDAEITVPAGLYFCRIDGWGFSQTIKMLYLK